MDKNKLYLSEWKQENQFPNKLWTLALKKNNFHPQEELVEVNVYSISM